MPERKTKRTKKLRKSYILKDFLIDCTKNSMYYGALVRSPSSFGKITNIGITSLPEGYYLYTARDIPGENVIHTLDTDTQIFCTEEVHYAGEPVGILVGPDIQKVRKLASEIQLTFDISTIENVAKNLSRIYKRPFLELPGYVTDKDSAIADIVDDLNILPSLDSLPAPTEKSSYTAPEQITKVIESITPHHTESAVLAKREIRTGFFENVRDEKETDSFFKNADFDVSDVWTNREKSPVWIETSGALSYMEGSTLNVLSTTQWPAHLQKTLSNALNIDENRIEIRKTLSQSKNFNGTWRTTTLAVQSALAAVLSDHPVKLLLTRKEQELFNAPGISVTITQRSAVDKEGHIKAMQVFIEGDAGYTNPFAKEIAYRLSIACANFYCPENLYICTTIKNSPNPPTSISLETIDSGAFFAVENHLNHIAHLTGIHPDELRFINMNNEKSIFKYKNIKYEEAVKAVVQASDFSRKYATFRLTTHYDGLQNGRIFTSLPKRGIAMTCAYEGAYFYGTTLSVSEQKMEVTLELDGSVTINSPIPSDSIAEIWKKIVSENLQIDVSNITITADENSSQFDENSLPESLSSNVSLMTTLLKRCCGEIQKKRFLNPLPITAKKSPTPAMKRQWNREKFSGYPFYSTSFGTAIVEVEIHPYTYKQKINGIWIAIDCGEILSFKAAENTVKLSIRQELEHLTEDDSISCDMIKIYFIQSSNPPCQLGSLIHNLIPAAFASATSQAISEVISEVPCTDEQIFTLLEKQRQLDATLEYKESAEAGESTETENKAEEQEENAGNQAQTEEQQ